MYDSHSHHIALSEMMVAFLIDKSVTYCIYVPSALTSWQRCWQAIRNAVQFIREGLGLPRGTCAVSKLCGNWGSWRTLGLTGVLLSIGDVTVSPGGMLPRELRVWVSVAGGTPPSETCGGEDMLRYIRLWYSFIFSWTEKRKDPYLFHYQSWYFLQLLGPNLCQELTACFPKFYSLSRGVLATLNVGFASCHIKGNKKAFWHLRS